MKPKKLTVVIDRKRYSTQTATLIASDAYWDGHNYERRGRNTFLYRTPKGNYFALRMTQWQGENDAIEPMSQAEAITLWEQLQVHEVEFEQAFPGVKVEEA